MANIAQTGRQETIKQLERKRAALRAEQKRLDARIAKQRSAAAKYASAHAVTERQKRRAGQRLAEMTNRIFVRSVPTPEFIVARDILMEKLRLSQSDHITVAKQRELEAEIKSFKASLQKLCRHPLVFSYDGYGGSRSMDYDDACSGHRVCTLCNVGETSQGTREDVYTVLVEDNTRLVCRDLRRKEDLPKAVEEEWFTVPFLRNLFEASAGSLNVEWPKVVESKFVLKVED